jgi:hypothetical protein
MAALNSVWDAPNKSPRTSEAAASMKRSNAFRRQELPQLLLPLGGNIGKPLPRSRLKDSGSF